MNRLTKLGKIMLITIFFLITVSGQGIAKEKVYELKFQGVYPEMHPNIKNVIKPWIEKVKEMSGGRLLIHYFPPNAIVKQKDQWKAVKSGIIDITSNAQGRNPGKFPLSEIIELPFLFPSSEVGSQVTWKLFEKYPEWKKEYEGTKLLFHWVSATAQLTTVKKPVDSLETLKGMKVIGWSPALLAVPEILGANPVNLPPMDTYLALERKMADAAHVSYAAMVPFKLSEAAKYITEADTMVVPFYCVINEKKFNKLPEDLQKIIIDTTGELMSSTCGKNLDAGAAWGLDQIQKKGMERIILTKEEKERWIEAAMPLREKWLASMDKKGLRVARKMLEDVIKMTEEMSN